MYNCSKKYRKRYDVILYDVNKYRKVHQWQGQWDRPQRGERTRTFRDMGKIGRYGSDSSSATRRCDGDDLPLVPAHSLVAALRCSSRELLRSFCVLPGLPPTAHTVKECAGERLVSERDVAIFSPPSCSFAWLAFLLVACCCCFCSSCTTRASYCICRLCTGMYVPVRECKIPRSTCTCTGNLIVRRNS